jgi:hypothetical protein
LPTRQLGCGNPVSCWRRLRDWQYAGENPTDRGKPGSKCHLLTDRRGLPLAGGLSAANTHDGMLLEAMVDAVAPVKGPPRSPLSTPAGARPSCTATRATTTRAAAGAAPAGDLLADRPAWHRIERAAGCHRYVVERSLAWLVGYRRLQVRYDRRTTCCSGSCICPAR